MTRITRNVLVMIATLFGLSFLVLGIAILLDGRSGVWGAIYIPLGIVWLAGATVIFRRTPKL
ncbi:hypothetical protein [Cryobacterium sp. GrIS_2_6]|uniref:hypothetical protein n=1 Tax=Cryobacterium sp. GrIS_2_6 TaxID=3162785 RepID=UPI002DFC9FF8|nr:hypothetical protein [Cryobacterium psychrotolerans]